MAREEESHNRRSPRKGGRGIGEEDGIFGYGIWGDGEAGDHVQRGFRQAEPVPPPPPQPAMPKVGAQRLMPERKRGGVLMTKLAAKVETESEERA